jgi:hypothetical protein
MTAFEDNLIIKIFVFQIVNSYAALFYIAFIEESTAGKCLNNTCTGEVASTLSTIFISRLLTANITEVVLPKINLNKRQKNETRGLFPGAKITPIESQYTLENYDMTRNLLQDYAELIIQYGYVVLFVAAFPLAPAFAYVSNYCEIRIDGWKVVLLSFQIM